MCVYVCMCVHMCVGVRVREGVGRVPGVSLPIKALAGRASPGLKVAEQLIRELNNILDAAIEKSLAAFSRVISMN